ncbi:hypothetical protein AAFF_G00340190 [Aldrovandia affinis]|uniref:Uncharacterized protein n=1 Tax=Aldrovandia affinis TaxID=143900 RepID=A0AAD7WP47_9TELE|nr:hypothetical protein AAFF_G00340190 [Aldrovandia affinis]
MVDVAVFQTKPSVSVFLQLPDVSQGLQNKSADKGPEKHPLGSAGSCRHRRSEAVPPCELQTSPRSPFTSPHETVNTCPRGRRNVRHDASATVSATRHRR